MPESQITDLAILEKTGQTREHWHRLLDEFDCRTKGHRETAKWLYETKGVSYWWAQSLTVDYERARGIRVVGQRSGGVFAVNVSRTVDASAQKAWQFFAEGEYKQISKSVPGGRLHLDWAEPQSMVIVEFLSKGSEKTTVAVTHEKLPDKAAVDAMKLFWNEKLDALKQLLSAPAAPSA